MMFRKRSPLRPAHMEFVSADQVRAAAARIPTRAERESVAVRSAVPLRAFYASRLGASKDPAWRYLASCVLLAPDLDAARDQLALALRQRGSAARADDYDVRAIPDAAPGGAEGIVLTTMVGPG